MAARYGRLLLNLKYGVQAAILTEGWAGTLTYMSISGLKRVQSDIFCHVGWSDCE